MYYLNSRYYNPEIGRFINADGLIGETGDILSHNMYAYTKNNPVMMVDPSGYAPEWIKDILIGAAVIVTVAAVSALIVSTGGAGVAFLPAFATALKTGFTIATIAGGVSGTIRSTRSAIKHSQNGSNIKETLSGMGKSFLYGFGDGFLAGSKYYAATSIVGIAGNAISSRLDFGNGLGYGYQTRSYMFGYQNPKVAGFTLLASTTGKKLRIDIDPFHSLHYHKGASKKIREPHKGAWIGGIIVGVYTGFNGDVY